MLSLSQGVLGVYSFVIIQILLKISASRRAAPAPQKRKLEEGPAQPLRHSRNCQFWVTEWYSNDVPPWRHSHDDFDSGCHFHGDKSLSRDGLPFRLPVGWTRKLSDSTSFMDSLKIDVGKKFSALAELSSLQRALRKAHFSNVKD